MPQHRFNHLHERLLYNWIGRDIEDEGDKLSTGYYATEYLNHLLGSLEKGLWLTNDRMPLLRDYVPSSPVPMVCFTELTLKDCIAHSTRYGKLGLGFTKKFVLSNGGQPVAYIRDRKSSPFVLYLRELLKKDDFNPTAKKRVEALACYLKNMEKQRERKARSTKSKAKPKSATSVVRKRKIDPFKRQTGSILHFLEEAEWRIIEQGSPQRKSSRLVKNLESSNPVYHLPYESGYELVTIVFPNNRVFSMAMRDPKIVERLFPNDRPPVNLVSLEDIKHL